jgi:PAS domain-containing protein
VLLLAIVVFFAFCAIFFAFFVVFAMKNTNPPPKSQNLLVLEILQKSDKAWCIIPLSENFDEHKFDDGAGEEDRQNITYSLGFLKIIERITENAAPLTLTRLSKVIGDKNPSFYEGIKHIVRFGGGFSCDIVVAEKHYFVEGTIINTNQQDTASATLQHESGGILLTVSDRSALVSLNVDIQHLKQAESRLSLLLNSLPIPVWTKNSDGKIDFCNKAYAKLLETQPHHVVSRQWDLMNCVTEQPLLPANNEFLPDNSASELPRQRDTVHQRTTTEDPRNKPSENWKKGRVLEVCLKNKETMLKVEELVLNSKLAQKPDGHLEGAQKKHNLEGINAAAVNIICVATDISKYKNIIGQDKYWFKIYKHILDNMKIPFIVFDSNGIAKMHNRQFLQLFPLKPDFLGQNASYDDIIEHLYELRKLPEYIGADIIKSTFKNWIDGSVQLQSEMWHMPDGAVLNVQPSKCEFDGILIIIEDITQELGIEGKYKSLLSVYNEIVFRSRDAVLMIGTDHKIRQCSESVCSILNVDSNGIIGRPVKEWLDSFATQHNIQGWKESIITAIELRNRKFEYFQTNNEEFMASEYLPLPNGWHMLAFFNSSENSAEKIHLFSDVKKIAAS